MKVARWSTGGAVALWLAFGAAGLGCADNPPPSAQAPAAGGGEQGQLAGDAVDTDDSDSQDLKAHHRHHQGGFEHFVLLALETLGVTPEQQAQIDKIVADLHTKTQPVRDAQKSVLMALADGVGAGNVDKAKVDAAIAAIAAAAAQTHDAAADAMNQLHAVLRPEQRVALVDKVEAHWTMWKDANADEKAAVAERENGAHIALLAKEIGLTGEQVDKVKASFPSSLAAHAQEKGRFDPAEGDAHLKAFRAAFAAEAFDAKALATSAPVHSHMATWGVNRMARFYETLAPVLTPEQRPKVADKLRNYANKI